MLWFVYNAKSTNRNAMTTTLDEYYNAFKYGDNTLFSLKRGGWNK
jgi:hypothetical protein